MPRHRKRNEVEKNKYSSPYIEFLLDSTKCYGDREAYNMPRSVSENFETNAVKKLSKASLKNPIVKKPEGRYLVEVSDSSAEIVEVSSPTNEKCMSRFKNINERTL